MNSHLALLGCKGDVELLGVLRAAAAQAPGPTHAWLPGAHRHADHVLCSVVARHEVRVVAQQQRIQAAHTCGRVRRAVRDLRVSN